MFIPDLLLSYLLHLLEQRVIFVGENGPALDA
jgi:hypothetical protein